MAQAYDFDWPQGEDLVISLNYKEGDTANKALVVNLSSGYSARMDLVLPSTRAVVLTANDGDEITLGNGLNKQPNVEIILPRSHTLPGSPMHTAMAGSMSLGYDLFIRNLTTDIQVKVLHGTIKIKRSNTLWA